ncbi:MAG: PDZ domain-containing protein [Planctomycetota bacterium]|nr:PDZ domain-containing protein [Planctomycetota bacterium]
MTSLEQTRHTLRLWSAGLLLLALVVADATAQRGPRRSGLRAMAQNDEVKAAYAPIVERANQSVVEVLRNGDPCVLGTVVAKGLVVTKASELDAGRGDSEGDEEEPEDEFSCQAGDREFPCKRVGFDRVTDLALLSVPDLDLPPVVWATKEPKVGAFLASPDGSRLPVGIGVLAAAPYTYTKAFLGVQFVRGAAASDPAELAVVLDDGAAKAAGLLAGDVVIGFDEEEIESQQELREQLALCKPGDEVRVTVQRDDAQLQFDVELGQNLPDPERPNPRQRRNPQRELWGPLSDVRTGFGEILQHDTVLEPLDCGGPVVDLDGRAVGINIARAGRVETLALPGKVVRAVVAKIRPTDKPKK